MRSFSCFLFLHLQGYVVQDADRLFAVD